MVYHLPIDRILIAVIIYIEKFFNTKETIKNEKKKI